MNRITFGYGTICFVRSKQVQVQVIFTTRKRSLGQGNSFVPVCHSVHGGGGGWYPNMHCWWYPSMLCSRSAGGGEVGIPACLAGDIPACLAGLWGGGVSRPTPRGEVEGSGQGGLETHTRGDLQVHSQGGLRPTPRWVSRPTPRGCVFQHALRQTPPVDGYYRGRYASCWNAFLFQCFIGGSVPNAPFGPISFIFIQVLAKILANNRFSVQTQGLVPPSGKSWIRHCKMKLTFTIGPNVLLTEGMT